MDQIPHLLQACSPPARLGRTYLEFLRIVLLYLSVSVPIRIFTQTDGDPFMYRSILAALAAISLLLPGWHPADAQWNYPVDVAAAEDGTIYIADLRLPGIWTLKDGQTEVFVQASKKFRTPLNAIRCLRINGDGLLHTGDSAAREVFSVNAEGGLTQLTAPTAVLDETVLSEDLEFTPDNFGLIGIPMDMAFGSKGEMYVSDTELQRVWKVPAGGGEPEEVLLVNGPRGLAVDDDDNLWVLSLQAPQLQKVSPDGEVEELISELTFEFPHQIELRGDGTAVVSDGYAKAIWNVAADGKVEKWISGEPLDNPVGITFQGENLLIIDPRANALFSAAPDGTLTKVYPTD
mgnify:FL=1